MHFSVNIINVLNFAILQLGVYIYSNALGLIVTHLMKQIIYNIICVT